MLTWTNIAKCVYKELKVNFHSENNSQQMFHEDISEYVAQLQLHMTLQARNLVPTLTEVKQSSRHQLLQETQAVVEKLASRQSI